MVIANKIKRLLKRNSQVYTILGREAVTHAARVMSEHNVGCLVVVDAAGQAVGILSERDIVAKVVSSETDPGAVRVEDIMTRQVISCGLQTPIDSARRLMSRHHTRHLPILENGAAVGMISSRDIMSHELRAARAMVRKQSQLLQNLETSTPGITHLRKDTRGRIVI